MIHLFIWPFFLLLFQTSDKEQLREPILEKPVAEVLNLLSDVPSTHLPQANIAGMSMERGKDLVLHGQTISPDGSKSNRISRHFVCISCHNVERDEPDLKASNPELRLKYASKKGLAYLQGSSFYGIVDRTSYYNGDYEKKYGKLVDKARNNLRESIQLCATECSQGRLLEDWELESILAYFWTIGLKMQDLELMQEDLISIEKAIESGIGRSGAITKIKSYYLQGIPGTFLLPPPDRKAGYSTIGNLENGKLLYELSCLHCHGQKKFSQFALDDTGLSFQFLIKHFPTYSRYSVYQVARYGTSPLPGKKAYMPNYTKEKMSDQMLEDLRAYIKHMAEQ